MKNRHLHGIHVFRAVYAAVPFFPPCLRRGGGLVFPAPWQVPDGTISWMCVLGALPFAVMGSRILQRFTCPEETDRAYKVRFEIKETPCGILLCPEGRAKLRKHPAGIPLCPRCRASN